MAFLGRFTTQWDMDRCAVYILTPTRVLTAGGPGYTSPPIFSSPLMPFFFFHVHPLKHLLTGSRMTKLPGDWFVQSHIVLDTADDISSSTASCMCLGRS